MDKLSASEALYGFAGWLTTRNEATIMSSKHDCAPVADRIREFCEENNLSEPKTHWEKNLVHPKPKKSIFQTILHIINFLNTDR